MRRRAPAPPVAQQWGGGPFADKSASNRAYEAARRLRKDLSLPEVLLWNRLRDANVRIRRQHPIGPYVLDFHCAATKLAIEVDGFAHETGDRPKRDEVRSAWLESQGLTIMRIPAKEVLADPDSVAEGLLRICGGGEEPLHHSAMPSGPPPRASGTGRT